MTAFSAVPGPDADLADEAAAARTGFASWSVFIILLSCLLLQRFGVPAGAFKLNIATVATFLVVLAGIALRRIAISPTALLYYLLFAALAAGTAIINFQFDRYAQYRQSFPSLIHFVGLFLPFIFRARDPISEGEVFRTVQKFMLFLAICGIGQFAAQFVGLSLFSFREFVPADFLIEEGYNLTIPVTQGAGYFKSNGLFLIEPSVASQFVAIGMMLELLYFKRAWALGTLALAMFVTVSGTGLMVISLFLVLYFFSARSGGKREILLALGVVALFAILVTLVFEEVGDALLERRTEFFDESSSGYQRFVSPWRGLLVLIERHPSYLLYGVGPGAAETIDFAFTHWTNTPFKLISEYGAPLFVLWCAMFLHAIRRPGNGLLIIPMIYFFFFTGGYHQFGPAIYFLFAMFTLNATDQRSA
jgi:hypothetical protein